MAGLTVTIGEVVKVEHRERSIVSGGGASGGVTRMPDGRLYGAVRSSPVSTNIESEDVVWMRTDAGIEIEWRFYDDQFGCREGHRIAVIHNDGDLYTVLNYQTRSQVRFKNENQIRNAYPKVSDSSIGLWGAVLIGAIIGSAVITIGNQPEQQQDRDGYLAFAVAVFILALAAIPFAILSAIKAKDARSVQEGEVQVLLNRWRSLEAQL
ncbi:MAG TPA: hypothetical protein VHD32_13545 [Candidatus Didemnitutus sp.]|nr:hypothetical protein [Candidatus Didemnitutus sp.]